MKKIIITGASGVVGSNLVKNIITNKKYELICLFNENNININSCLNIKVDITNTEEVLELWKLKPDFIIHCAALTNINFCENNQALAYNINVNGTKNIVELAKKAGAKLIYISTDAVFDGIKGNYNEEDSPNPMNIYGKTKHEGEKICMKNLVNSIIARISVFGFSLNEHRGDKKKSFIENIVYRLNNRKELVGFIDAKTSMIYVKYLGDILIKLFEKDLNGIFHIGGLQSLSKYEFMIRIAEIFGFDNSLIKKSSIESLNNNDHIRRPKDCSFDITKFINAINFKIPDLDNMLREFKKDYFLYNNTEG